MSQMGKAYLAILMLPGKIAKISWEENTGEMFYVWLTVLARLKGGSPRAMLTHMRLLTNQIAIHHLVISGGNEC